MELAINNNIYRRARLYTDRRGLNLTSVVENFLLQLVANDETKEHEITPDIVMSLLGAGEPIADDDLNARKAYYQHLEEKYQ